MTEKTYIAIDLKSFYASVECVERGLDALTTNLVVADKNRTEKTICLAVSPSLKAYGIPGRARLFEVVEKVRQINAMRQSKAPGRVLNGQSWNDTELKNDPSLKLDYITAAPRMSYYMAYSAKIYNIYLKYVAASDIHVYSIDEVFMDVTSYLLASGLSAREFAMKIILDVLNTTGITATAGIGTNLYLCKIAMDIQAKHIPPDKNGVRIAELTEMSYRRLLWDHRPLTDFWRIGPGTARRLARSGIYTQGAIAHTDEDFLYDTFGVDAELLIDHAWGREPVTMQDIKAYKPKNNSISSGQVLMRDYSFEEGRLIVREMADEICMSLVRRNMVARSFGLMAGYSASQHAAPDTGGFTIDPPTNAASVIVPKFLKVYENIADRDLKLRRFNLTAACMTPDIGSRQLSLFDDLPEANALKEEKQLQKAVISIREKYGKSAMFRGHDLQKGATAIERSHQIGGHRSGDEDEKRK